MCSYEQPDSAVDESCPECGLSAAEAYWRRRWRNARGIALAAFGGMGAGALVIGIWELSVTGFSAATLGRVLAYHAVLSASIGLLSLPIAIRQVPLRRSTWIVGVATAMPWPVFVALVYLLTPIVLWFAYVPAIAGAVVLPLTLVTVSLLLSTETVRRPGRKRPGARLSGSASS